MRILQEQKFAVHPTYPKNCSCIFRIPSIHGHKKIAAFSGGDLKEERVMKTEIHFP